MLQSFIYCEQCDRELQHPIWLRYDHDDHKAHCHECAVKRDRLLTPESAICEALIIVGVWQGSHRIEVAQ